MTNPFGFSIFSLKVHFSEGITNLGYRNDAFILFYDCFKSHFNSNQNTSNAILNCLSTVLFQIKYSFPLCMFKLFLRLL